ncbi:MAG: ABC transporter substrate-binding protein [Verrucomicrobiales bacterium]|nr:ABC transporter substrate-binding protein [Verrucomicrobiales bacterium]
MNRTIASSKSPGPRLAVQRRSPAALRVGYVPLIHAAPLLVARELGLFARHGLQVRLTREVGWATVREKIVSGELDAAQTLAPMAVAMTLGLHSARVDCLTGLIMNLHGNAVVIAQKLWATTAGHPSQLAAIRARRSEPLTLGVVYPHSAQCLVLHRWCRQAGLVPDRDYRLVVVPPPQMVAHLKGGHIDGCCVGEPWGSLAVRDGIGVIAALSADLAPGHAEKVLLVRHSFSQDRPDHHFALIRALHEACAWCAAPDHRGDVLALLAGRDGLSLPTDVLRPALTGDFDLGAGRRRHHPDALIFHGDGVNEPSFGRVAWIPEQLGIPSSPELLHRSFRSDLFRTAIHATSHNPQSPLPHALDHEIATCAV